MVDPRRALVACVAALAALCLALPAASARGEDVPVPRPVLTLPVSESRIVAVAALPPLPWLPGHRGIDVSAVVGAPVVAPGRGRVAFVGTVAGRDVVTIDLDAGVTATLEPVTGSLAPGTRVSRGETVGVVASTAGHCAPATCVHWGVKFGRQYLDPLDWLEGFGPIVLLPLASAAQQAGPGPPIGAQQAGAGPPVGALRAGAGPPVGALPIGARPVRAARRACRVGCQRGG